MALEPVLWALHDSPAADTTERLILSGLAEKADADGCNAFPSRRTLARIAICDVKTVQRKIAGLLARGVIRLGDQAAARYIPEHVRPRVYDLMIPAQWYGVERLARVNDDRAGRGLPPLTPTARPALAVAPARTDRADKGKPRPKKDVGRGGDSQSPPSNPPGGDSQSRGGGDSQSPGGGLSVPQLSPVTLPSTETLPQSRPSVRTPEVGAREAAGTDGGTDGGGDVVQEEEPGQAGGAGPAAADAAPDNSAAAGEGAPADSSPGAAPASAGQVEVTPGVDLLLSIASGNPAFTLTGRTLADQGVMVTGLLAAGWSREHLRQVIAGRPLPHPLTRTVGAVVAARLREAAAGVPPNLSAGPRPGIPAQPGPAPAAVDETPTPVGWEARRTEIAAAVAGRGPLPNCAEDAPGAAGCDQLAVRGEDRCPAHLGWPVCAACERFRVRPGRGMCEACEADPRYALSLAAGRAAQEDYYESGQFERDARAEDWPQPQEAPF